MTDTTTTAPAAEPAAAPAAEPAAGGETLVTSGEPAAEPAAEPAPATGETLVTEPAPEPTPQPAGAPEEYGDFAFPEGVGPDTEMLGEVTPVFKELGLSQEQAQKLVDFDVKYRVAHHEKAQQEFQQARKEWVTQIKSDAELGGAAFNTTVKNAGKAVKQFGDAELQDLLNKTGLGDHPSFVRAFSKIGALLGEDTTVSGESRSPVQTAAQLLYPTMKN